MVRRGWEKKLLGATVDSPEEGGLILVIHKGERTAESRWLLQAHNSLSLNEE